MRSNTEISSEEESNTHVTRRVVADELEGVPFVSSAER